MCGARVMRTGRWQYNFVDKGGYNVTLRPEMTPSLARMVLAREKELLLPLKWFAIPQCFRFENLQARRPSLRLPTTARRASRRAPTALGCCAAQRGRKREHYQWNMDIVGVSVRPPPPA